MVNNVRKMSVNGDGRVFEYPSALFALFFLQSTGGASNLSQSLQMQKDHLTVRIQGSSLLACELQCARCTANAMLCRTARRLSTMFQSSR